MSGGRDNEEVAWLVDYFTVSLHSPNGRQMPAIMAV